MKQGTKSDFPEARPLTSRVLFLSNIHSGRKTDESPTANPRDGYLLVLAQITMIEIAKTGKNEIDIWQCVLFHPVGAVERLRMPGELWRSALRGAMGHSRTALHTHGK